MKIHRTKRGYAVVGLSKNDLSALVTILASVGGHPHGPRGVAKRLLDAGETVGMRWEDEEKKYKIVGFVMIARA